MHGNKTDIFIDEALIDETRINQIRRFDAFRETNVMGPDYISPFQWLETGAENDVMKLRIALESALDNLKKYESKPPFWQFWKK